MVGAVEVLTTWLFLGGPLNALFAYALAGPDKHDRRNWALVAYVFPPTLLFLLVRRVRHAGEPGARSVPVTPPRPRPEPIAVPDEEAVESLEGRVSACPDCGSIDVGAPGIRDGAWAGGGELITYVCRRCHYRGMPLVFERAEEYRDFVAALHHE